MRDDDGALTEQTDYGAYSLETCAHLPQPEQPVATGEALAAIVDDVEAR